jgi:mono/diheme cytochrome c family protein
MLRSICRFSIPVLAATVLAIGCGRGDRTAESGGGAPPASPTAPAEPAPQAQQAAPAAESGGAAGIPAAARQEADQIFASRCTPCHGEAGMGNGPASKGLTPPPRNFHDKAWQASVTDEHIEQIIQYGGAAVGKSPAMPANPDLTSKPQVVAALMEKIRSFGK